MKQHITIEQLKQIDWEKFNAKFQYSVKEIEELYKDITMTKEIEMDIIAHHFNIGKLIQILGGIIGLIEIDDFNCYITLEMVGYKFVSIEPNLIDALWEAVKYILKEKTNE